MVKGKVPYQCDSVPRRMILTKRAFIGLAVWYFVIEHLVLMGQHVVLQIPKIFTYFSTFEALRTRCVVMSL